MRGGELSIRHLLLSLRPINRALRHAVARQAEIGTRLDRPDLALHCITDQQVKDLLGDVDELPRYSLPANNPSSIRGLNAEEVAIEQDLRRDAIHQKRSLPLDDLTQILEFTTFEKAAILLCAAPEIDRAYERIFGYILDDLNRRFPCVELLSHLAASNVFERLTFRRALTPHGRLRQCGLLQSFGDASTGLRTNLRLGPNVMEFLLGSNSDAIEMWRDPLEVNCRARYSSAVSPSDNRLQRIASSVADGTIGVVGVWGEPGADPEFAVTSIARIAGKPLRRMDWACPIPAAEIRSHVAAAIHGAALSGAMLWIPIDLLHDVENQALAAILIEGLIASGVPVALTGIEPWRPTAVLAARSYIELTLTAPGQWLREAQWLAAIPEADPNRLEDLASCYRMSPQEMCAVARLARTEAELEDNPQHATVDDKLKMACATVSRKTRGRFVGDVKTRRTADDLILPAELHRQVMEIASFTRVLPQVAENWGFGRLAGGGSGVKCLFTGDPGTGKTLAAEVVADSLGVPFLKINIAETVSKWVGETEKNLETAFREAASSNALLFFDEADALFGKRGEVQHGVDRYANMEVSHLLQRLEDHSGLVVLASNLKDNIDPAFTRRFHVVIHFPRPDEKDRRRIWRLAFPTQAPLQEDVDINALARLDMTGAGIVAAARTAALVAASVDDGGKITMTHILRAISRQFHREARVLTTAELGQYARLLLQDQP